MAKAGRPKIAPKKRRQSIISIRVQPHERKALEEKARRAGKKLSAYIRDNLLAP